MPPVARSTDLEKGSQKKGEVLMHASFTNFGEITFMSWGVGRTPGISIQWCSNAQVTGSTGIF